MFTALTVAIRQLFAMFTTLFSAGEKVAKTFDNLAGWGEAASESIATVASIERQVNRFEAISAAKERAKLLGITLNDQLEIATTVEAKAAKPKAITAVAAA